MVKTLGSVGPRGDPGRRLARFLVLGLFAASAGMTTIAAGWTDVLDLLGAHVGRWRVIGWYYVGELGKYLPGGVWPVLGRGELARRGGVGRSVAYASVGLSLATLYLAAALTALVFLLQPGRWWPLRRGDAAAPAAADRSARAAPEGHRAVPRPRPAPPGATS